MSTPMAPQLSMAAPGTRWAALFSEGLQGDTLQGCLKVTFNATTESILEAKFHRPRLQ
jgi:hypothetical protein